MLSVLRWLLLVGWPGDGRRGARRLPARGPPRGGGALGGECLPVARAALRRRVGGTAGTRGCIRAALVGTAWAQDGYGTLIGEGTGVSLPAPTVLRLVLARALIRKPKVRGMGATGPARPHLPQLSFPLSASPTSHVDGPILLCGLSTLAADRAAGRRRRVCRGRHARAALLGEASTSPHARSTDCRLQAQECQLVRGGRCRRSSRTSAARAPPSSSPPTGPAASPARPRSTAWRTAGPGPAGRRSTAGGDRRRAKRRRNFLCPNALL